MSKSGRSLYLFGIYTLLNGIGLILVPNQMLSLFNVPTTEEIWVRVVGMLIILLGLYYTMAGQADNSHFIQLSVYGRLGVFSFWLVVVILNLVPPVLLFVGFIDFLGAVWTQQLLRSDIK